MSKFGYSDFGYDGSAAIGLGKGSFGNGWFGFDAEAIKWYRKAADQGNVMAQYTLSSVYANGKGVLQTGSGAVKASWMFRDFQDAVALLELLLAMEEMT